MRTRRTLHTRRTLVRLSIITQRIIRMIQLPVDIRVSATTDFRLPFPLNRAAVHGASTACRCAGKFHIIFISIYDKLAPSIPSSRIFQDISSSSVSLTLARSLAYGEQTSFFCNRRSTLPHTDCKLLCYNFLSINWLSLLVFLSLPARYTWLYCYTLICVPHVMWRRVRRVFCSFFDRFTVFRSLPLTNV